jgi:UDPglucose 6-dehydrogenase
MAEDMGHEPQILNAVMKVNGERRAMMVERLDELLDGVKGKRIGLLGLAFKPNTDDMRDAPSIDISRELIAKGASVQAFDPVAMDVAKSMLPDVEMMPDAYAVASGADALVVVTEWNEFKHLDLERIRDSMQQPIILDGRNIYQPELIKALGFRYRGVGRGYNGGADSKIKTEVKVRPNAA